MVTIVSWFMTTILCLRHATQQQQEQQSHKKTTSTIRSLRPTGQSVRMISSVDDTWIYTTVVWYLIHAHGVHAERLAPFAVVHLRCHCGSRNESDTPIKSSRDAHHSRNVKMVTKKNAFFAMRTTTDRACLWKQNSERYLYVLL